MREDHQQGQFLYLNRDNRWRGFRRRNLALHDDGTLTLDTLPRLGDGASAPPRLPAPSGPAGIALAPDGTIFYTDPDQHAVRMLDTCDGQPIGLSCARGQGASVTQFQSPRGLCFHEARHALLVADGGNRRIQLFDVSTHQLIGLWDDPAGPLALACDADGNVYVLDANGPAIARRTLTGRVVDGFSQTLQASLNAHNASLGNPVALAVQPGGHELLVLDASGRALVIDADGHYLGSADLSPHTGNPAGLAVEPGAFYIGDNAAGRIAKFKLERKRSPSGELTFTATLLGVASGYNGAVAALALSDDGYLFAVARGMLVRLGAHAGYVQTGFLFGGPFDNPDAHQEPFHWLRATWAQPAPTPDSHVQLFVRLADPAWRPPPEPGDRPPWQGNAVDYATLVADPDDGAMRNVWLRLPLDAPAALLRGRPGDRVWVGLSFSSEGATSPALSQVRIDFNHPTYLRHVPDVYQEDAASRRFLARFLTLFEDSFDRTERAIDNLPALFDPLAAPPEFLNWLAGWLAVTLNEDWDTARQRRAIAEAFETFAWRGTARGLQAEVRSYTGMDVVVEEPIAQTGWWVLPDASGEAPGTPSAGAVLGMNTFLVAAEPEGAALGTTAVLDRSYVIDDSHYGEPLTMDVAHRVTVRLYQGHAYSQAAIDQVRAVIERAVPAHVACQVCVVTPQTRVGYQSRVGLDAIVGRPDAADRFGLPLAAVAPARVGQAAVGKGSHL
jgi:phage tail-like protein